MNRSVDDARVTAELDEAAGPEFEAEDRKRALEITVRRARQEAVELALAQADGNVADAAELLGILRTSLYRLMKRFGIPPPSRSRS